MKNIYFFVFIFITNQINGQLIDFSKANPYRAVFTETDAFDSSFLTVLTNVYVSLLLRVADNCIGKQINTSPKGTGFGKKVVNLLALQLKGRLSLDTSTGITISINFKNTITH